MSKGRIDPIADIETVETELMLADLDSLERRVDALTQKSQGRRQGRQRKRSISINRALALLREGKPARLVERKPEEERAFHMLGLLTSLPVLYVCNVEEASAATGNDFSRKVEARAKAEGAAAVVISAKIESEIAVLVARGAQRISRRGRPQGGRPRPADPRRLRASRPRDLLHRRAEGDARLDGDARRQGAAGRRRHSHRFRARLHPRRNHRLCRIMSPAAAKPARATPARCGSKARTMSCRTATSCTSASRPSRNASFRSRANGSGPWPAR